MALREECLAMESSFVSNEAYKRLYLVLLRHNTREVQL